LADEIGKAMQKVGGTAGSLQIPFEKVSSWIAELSSRTREAPETIGQSVKSILARVQNLKEKGFDEIDGTQINQVAKALDSVGIKITDSQGQFRNFGTVLDELGGKWKGLDSRQKAYLSTVVAGTYQQSKFLNLMEGYGDSVKIYNQSLDSAGTAQKKFDLYLQGTEAQLNQLKDTWQAVWMSAFNSQSLQNIIGGLNGLAKGIQFVVDHVGLFPSVIGVATTAFLLLNSTTRSSILNFGVLSSSLVRVGDALPIVAGNARIAQSALYNLTLAGRAAGAGLGLLGTIAKGTLSFIATTALPIAVFAALSFAIGKVTQAISDYNEKQKELKKEQDDIVKSYSSNSNEIDKLASKYENLSKQVASGKIEQTNKDYIDTMNQLGKLMPTLVQSEDEHGNKIIRSSKAVKEELDYAKQLKDIADKTTVANFDKDLETQASKVDNILKQIDKFKSESKSLAASPMVQSGKSKYFDEGSILETQRQQVAQERELQLALQNSKSYIKDKAQAFMDMEGTTQKLSSSQQKLITSYINESVASKKNIKDGEDFKKFLSDTTNNAANLAKIFAQLPDDLNGAFSAKDLLGFSKDQIAYLKSIGTIVKDGGTNWDGYKNALKAVFKDGDTVKKIIDALKDSTKKGSDTTNEATYSVDELDKALKDAKGSYSDTADAINKMIQSKQNDMAVTATQGQLYSELSDKISPVNKVLEDLANGQSVSASTAMDLIQKIPEMTKYLSIQNGQVSVNTQGILDWRDAQINSFNDIIKAQQKSLEAQKSALSQKLKMYGIDLSAIKTVAEAQQQLYDALSKKAKDEGRVAVNPDQAYPGLMDNLQGILDAEKQLDQLSSMASTGLTQVGTSIDKTNSSTEKSIYITDKYKQSMDQLTTALEKLKNLQQQYPNYSQAYRNALQQEIDLLKQQKDLTDNQAKNLQSQISSGIIQQTGMITSKSSSGGSSSSSNYNYASGGSTQAQIWNFLKGKGLSDSAIAGIMGNLQQESGFNTSARNPNGATGLAQWMGGRLSNLKSQANWSSLDTQLNFLWSEWAPMMSKYGASAFNSLNPSQAAYIFEKLFERSGGDANAKRQSFANQIYSQFAGSGGTYSASSSSISSDTSNSAAQQAQAIDQAKSDLLQLQQTSSSLQSQIQDIYLQMVQSQAAYYDHIKATNEAQLAQYDYIQNVQNKNSLTWMQTQMKRESAYQQQIKAEQDSIDYIKQQIAYNNQLNEAQKATLSDDVLQRQQELLSIEQKLYDTRSQMANDIVDTYKQALQDMKDATTKSIDNMINDINKEADKADYQKKLSNAQKSAQDIQDEINKLMLDDSTAAKKRIADLQKQLSDQNDSISQMVTDNNKQLQIDNLNAQKDAVSSYYDNMLNDEEKFSQMRSNILNINNQSVIDSLNSLSTQVQQNVNLLGTSVVNTLIDAINRANGYMIFSNQNADAIGHIASLDSGGLTGSWGSSGKLAMLHEKEIVLNQADTSNFLKAINLTRTLFNNLVKLPNLSGLVSSPATAGGNNYYVNFNVDKMNGNQSDVNNFITKFVNGIKLKGGDI
jgi:phage pi2 protein 07